MRATLTTGGAASLSNSSHLPPIDDSKFAKPVALPSGRARFPTTPLPTGSLIAAKTIGLVEPCSRTALVAGVLVVTTTSGASLVNSAAWHGYGRDRQRRSEGRSAGFDLRSSRASQVPPRMPQRASHTPH